MPFLIAYGCVGKFDPKRNVRLPIAEQSQTTPFLNGVRGGFAESLSGFVVERKVQISCCFPKGRMPLFFLET
jgi:hypothetical protein